MVIGSRSSRNTILAMLTMHPTEPPFQKMGYRLGKTLGEVYTFTGLPLRLQVRPSSLSKIFGSKVFLAWWMKSDEAARRLEVVNMAYFLQFVALLLVYSSPAFAVVIAPYLVLNQDQILQASKAAADAASLVVLQTQVPTPTGTPILSPSWTLATPNPE